MFVLVENNSITKHLNTSRGITIGENQYPRAIYTLWSTAEREAIGIYEVNFNNSNQKDGEYYNNTNQSFNFADGKVTASFGAATAKSLEDANGTDRDGVELDPVVVVPGLKTNKKEQIKKQAAGHLVLTDWYVIRKADAEIAIPAAVATHRAAVRTKSGEMEALVDACTTVEELVALYMYDPSSGTRPLGDFPILEV